MSVITYLQGFSKSVTRPWIMGILGFASVFIAVYSLYHEKTADLSFEIINEANVIDINKPLDDLSISYQGEDLVKNNLNLKVITTRIKNTGEVHIREGDFNSGTMWGIKVKNGSFVDVRIVESSSAFLDTTLNPRILKENIVEFTKLTLDREKFLTLEVLVIHKKETLPKLTHIGKIAGIDSVETIISYKSDEDKSFSEKVFSGNLKVQIARVGAYFLLGILVITSIVFLSIGGSKVAEKNQRRKRKKELKLLLGDADDEKGSFAKYKGAARKIYIERGPDYIHELNSMIGNKAKIKRELNRIQFIASRKYKKITPDRMERESVYLENEIRFRVDEIMNDLIGSGIVKVNGEEVMVDTGFIQSIRKIDKLHNR